MFSPKKFLSLSVRRQHKLAGEHLRLLFEQGAIDPHYRHIEELLGLPPLPNNPEDMADRFHHHMEMAAVSLNEHNFLVNRFDSLSDIPFGKVGVYLENLRSAYNIGSILRTVEAFRLGPVFFSEKTPFANHPKVIKTAMGTQSIVPCLRKTYNELPRPLIALETVADAPSLFDFEFPTICTLLLGNEEYGLSRKALEGADQVVQIPLLGSKNSLNVSCAFAILAAQLSKSFSNASGEK